MSIEPTKYPKDSYRNSFGEAKPVNKNFLDAYQAGRVFTNMIVSAEKDSLCNEISKSNEAILAYYKSSSFEFQESLDGWLNGCEDGLKEISQWQYK